MGTCPPVGFECSECGHNGSKVIDTRFRREHQAARRRRECLSCGHRYTTYELQGTIYLALSAFFIRDVLPKLETAEAQLEGCLNRVRSIKERVEEEI